jgi:conjugal transfer pilus assembly protein TraE
LLALVVILNLLGTVRTVVVPPSINKTFWVTRDKASSEYLEQMGSFIAWLVLDVTPASIDWKKDILLGYVEPEQHGAEDAAGSGSRAPEAHQRQHLLHAPATGAQRGRRSVVVRGRLRTLVNGLETANDLKAYLVEFSYSGGRMHLKTFKEVPNAANSLQQVIPAPLLPPRRIGQALSAIAILAAAWQRRPMRCRWSRPATAWPSRPSCRSRSPRASASRARRSPTCSATSTRATAVRRNACATRRRHRHAAAVNPGGEIVLECDRDKGEIYIRPVGDSAKPVNLFISSARPPTPWCCAARTRRPTPSSSATGRTPGLQGDEPQAVPGRAVRPFRQPHPRDEGDAGGDGLGPRAGDIRSTRSTNRCSCGPKPASR